MNPTIRRLLKPLTFLVISTVAFAPIADARPGGGGGHMGGGGGHMGGGGMGGGRPGGGGGPRPQINNANRDVRANNVRNTSVNNVNVNRNVVVANNGRNGYHGGWDNDYYHPVATAAAVTATVAVTSAVVGSMVRTVPAGCVPVNYGGLIYQQCGSTWYQPQNGAYVVINAPY